MAWRSGGRSTPRPDWPATVDQPTTSVAYKSSQPQPGQRYTVTARCSFPVIFVPVQKDVAGRPATQIVTKTTLFLSPGIKPSSMCVPHLRHLGVEFMLTSLNRIDLADSCTLSQPPRLAPICFEMNCCEPTSLLAWEPGGRSSRRPDWAIWLAWGVSAIRAGWELPRFEVWDNAVVDKPIRPVVDENHLVVFNFHARLGIVLACACLKHQMFLLKMVTPVRDTISGRPPLGRWPCGGCTVGIVSDVKRFFDRLLINSNPSPRSHET